VISALDCILEDGWCDAVLILRGGGGKLDLSCYDDYELAAVIAQFPIPVLVAVGHDQDYHVCDMVANVSVKTPTALADYFIGIYEDEDARLSALQTRMKLAVNQHISQALMSLDRLRLRIRGAADLRMEKMESSLNVLQARIAASDPRRILNRGYSLILDAEGVVVKDARTRKAGDRISVMTSDVVMDCTVDTVSVK
jgi:exodeoxyribonuclease VII large subunit